jgi:hypothetical protein
VSRRAVLGGILFLVGLAQAREAKADEQLRFDVEATRAASTCVEGDVLRSKIAERLGRDPFDANAQRRLHVAFARPDRAWTAEIALYDADEKKTGARTLAREGATCAPLVNEVVFTIAVLLEELAPPPPAPPPPPPPPEPPPRDEAPAQPPPPTKLRIDASVGAAGAIGGSPAPNVGGEAIAGIDHGRLRLELGGRVFLPASSDGDVAVRTRLVYGRLAPCYGLLVISGCAAFAIGSVSGEATGEGVASSRIDGQVYAAGGPGVLSRVPFGDIVFVRAAIDFLFAFSRVGFDVGDRRVWTLPAVSAAATLGVGARLP